MSDLPESAARRGGMRDFFRMLGRKLGLGGNGEGGLRGALEELIEENREELGALALGADELEMLSNILQNGDLRIHEVMVPRADVIAVELATPFGEVARRLAGAAHSRLPVYRRSLDDIAGMIHVKDVLQSLTGCAEESGAVPEIAAILRPVLFVAPSMRVMNLLGKMRARRIHMAIVVDEYGGTDGLVTIEDLVEQIVGEIEDEHDTDEPEMIRPLGDGKFDIDARLDVEELEKALGTSLVDEDDDIDTAGGLVFSLAGRVPQIGERIRHASGVRFEVVDAEPRRILRLRVSAPRAVTASRG